MVTFVKGDVWAVFDANPQSVLFHGVTKNAPAAAGFAAQVLERFGPSMRLAHIGVDSGKARLIAPRVFAGVTQNFYKCAEPDLIVNAIIDAVAQTDETVTHVVMPLVGAGLGGLISVTARRAIERAGKQVRLDLIVYTGK